MDDKYAVQKVEIADDILNNNFSEAYNKALELLKNDTDNIDFVVFAAYSAALGGFFSEALEQFKQIDEWLKLNKVNFIEVNSLGLSESDIAELYARSYFGAKDFSSAKEKINLVKELNDGNFPNDFKSFVIKNEVQLTDPQTAEQIARELNATFDDRKSDAYRDFRFMRTNICLTAATNIVNGVSSPADLDAAMAQQITEYLVAIVECYEETNDDELNENERLVYQFGKEWLFGAAFALYKGNSYAMIGRPEMEISSRYDGVEACLAALHKLSDINNPNAQYMLANIYSKGVRVEQDDRKAFELYSKSVTNGSVDGYVNLAFYYNEGKAVPKDDNKALEYAKKAVEKGEKRAYALLGQIYLNSFNDVDNGCYWLKRAIASGDENAKSILQDVALQKVQNYEAKLEFIFTVNYAFKFHMCQENYSDPDSVEKFISYYIEIYNYIVFDMDVSLLFVLNCIYGQQFKLFATHGGIYSIDIFINSFNDVVESWDLDTRDFQFIGEVAKSASLNAQLELGEVVIAGLKPIEPAWDKVGKFIDDNANQWGWNRVLPDGKPWSYVPTLQRIMSHGEQKTEQQINSSGGYSSPNPVNSTGYCYVATAVYGSYDCPEVWTLRRFRDYKLMITKPGQAFIKFYYTVSPVCIKIFGNTKWFKAIFKNILDRFVAKLHKQGYDDTPYYDR